jgi:hypothetical protein
MLRVFVQGLHLDHSPSGRVAALLMRVSMSSANQSGSIARLQFREQRVVLDSLPTAAGNQSSPL